MNGYKIEEVARLCGLTKRTIRYYEEIGLLFPPERSAGGFRLYDDRHIERLKRIVGARDALGFSLQELQEFIGISDEFDSQREAARSVRRAEEKLERIADIERTIARQMKMIDQKLGKLQEYRKQLEQLSDRVQEAKTKYKTQE